MESISTDLAPYVRAIWKRKWLILGAVLLAAAASLGFSLREPRVYAVTALIKVGRIWNEPVEDPYVLTEIINSRPFLERVSEKLTQKRRPEALARALSAERLEGGKARNRYVYLIRLTARGQTPEEATDLAKAATDQIIERTAKTFEAAYPAYAAREQALQNRVDALKTSIAASGNLTASAALEAERLELISVEQELFEAQMNNRSPLKTYRTELVEELAAPQAVPGASALKRLAVAAIAAFAIALLGALALEFGLPILKAATKGPLS